MPDDVIGIDGALVAERASLRRAIAPVRLAGVPLVIAALGAATDDPGRVWALALWFGLGWIPLQGMVWILASRRPRGPWWMFEATLDSIGAMAIVAAEPQALLAVVALTSGVGVLYTYQRTISVGMVAVAVFVGCAAVGDELAGRHHDMALYLMAIVGGWIGCAVAHQLTRFRIEARERLDAATVKAETLLTATSEAVVVTSPRGRLRQSNHVAGRVFPCASGAMSCHDGLQLHVGLQELDCSEGCRLLERSMQGEHETEVWVDVPGGERRFLLATASPITDDRGRVREIVHAFRDISRLREADEAKTAFLASTSHELKTPLTVISGFVQLLRAGELEREASGAALETIQARTDELMVIVERFLLASRIDGGRVVLDDEVVDLEAIVRERTDSLALATGRTVTVDVPADVPALRGDSMAVATALDHLVENAVKYSEPPTVVSVRVAVGPTEVTLAVVDHGPGMTPDEAARCFDRFYRAPGATTTRGSGIGLYVVRSLLESMGGSVSVESVPGIGTTFTATLRRVGSGCAEEAVVDRAPEPSLIRDLMRQSVPPARTQS